MRAKLASVRIPGAVAGRRALWAWAMLFWFGADFAHARAEPGFSLSLRAPAQSGCIDVAALTAQLEARTGRMTQTSDPAVHVDVQIVALERGYRAQVSLSDLRRELQVGGACSELDEVLVLVIASSLGVSAAAQIDKPAPQEKVAWQLELPQSAAAPELATRTSAGQPAVHWQLGIDASLQMWTGLMPRPTWGPGLSLHARRGALALRVGGSWLPSQSHTLSPAFVLRVTGGLAMIGLCGRAAGESRLIALFCADVLAGAVRATGDPLWQAPPRWDAWVMAVPRAYGGLQITRSFGVVLGLGAAIPLLFPRYAYENRSAEPLVAHTPELGLFAELALWLKIHP